MYGLVFAGGGVRGAYHIGVWKGLKEIGLEIGAAAGTSVGAVNAALFAQGDFNLAHDMWRMIEAEDIVKISECGGNIFEMKNIPKVIKEICSHDGMDMSPFCKLLKKTLNEDKIRSSGMDLGLAVYSLSEHEEKQIFIEDIPQGELADYIAASSAIFGVKDIDGEKLTDGGMANNMPADMLISRGYRDIITVNARGAGVYKNISTAGCNIIDIKCSEPMTGIMDFDRDGIAKSIEEGYLDCLKTFGRVGGNSYYIKKDSQEYFGVELIAGLEKAAEAFGIERLRLYTVKELAEEVIKCYTDEQNDKEAKLIHTLTDGLENGGELVKNGLEMLGSLYDAASAVLYFKRNFA